MRLLLTVLLLFAPALAAQGAVRAPDDAERMYREVGDQLFCICGCREKLLSCSHNVCEAKETERAFLRELSRDPGLDGAAIKQAMVTRFGQKVLQVPDDDGLYPVLIVMVTLLTAGFGGMLWYIAGRRKAQAEDAAANPAPVTASPELEQRLAREMQELDE